MTTGVPLPEPHGYFESAPPRMYTADQMHSHAAAVSAADNKALRERLNRLETALRIVREYPDFDGGGPLPDMIDDELAGRQSACVQTLFEIEAALKEKPWMT